MYQKLVHTAEGKQYFGINWALTTKCNYRCSYCHPSLHNGKIKTADYEKIAHFVNQVCDYCDERGLHPYFEYGGGEVTYLKWFGDLLELINRRKGLVSIISNGSTAIEWWHKHVHALYAANLSFHVEEVTDHEHFIAVAKVLEQSPCSRVHVNVMMLPSRFDECLAFAERLKREVSCSIALQPLYHGFGGGGLSGRFDYTEEQDRIMQQFRGESRSKDLPEPRSWINVERDDGLWFEKSTFDLIIEQQTNFAGWECNAGVENIVVTFQGDIYRAWCMQDGPIGHITDEQLVLPDQPTLCRTKICQCGTDICSTKTKRQQIIEIVPTT